MCEKQFKTYSCRFECAHDYTTVVVAADKRGVLISTNEFYPLRSGKGDPVGPDVYVEFSSEADLETVQDIFRNCMDLHVGLQTLRRGPLKNNPLKRDYDLM